MKCPNCSSLDDKVLESRMLSSGSSIRRRRECLNCGYRFTSYETIENKKIMVVKKDKRRELFNPDKLANGVQRAFEKRPISQKVIEELLTAIEEEIIIQSGEYHEIDSSIIGEMIMTRIKKIDSVAYIRFASVYRKFEDVSEFIKEIESINQ